MNNEGNTIRYDMTTIDTTMLVEAFGYGFSYPEVRGVPSHPLIGESPQLLAYHQL